jgi:hypothetical protein
VSDTEAADIPTALILIILPGAYIIITSMSLYILHQQKSKSIGSRVTIIYTWSMLWITVAWFYCDTRVSEVQLVEDPTFTDNPSPILSYCSITNIAGTLLSTLLFLGSDVLLVSLKSYLSRPREVNLIHASVLQDIHTFRKKLDLDVDSQRYLSLVHWCAYVAWKFLASLLAANSMLRHRHSHKLGLSLS